MKINKKILIVDILFIYFFFVTTLSNYSSGIFKSFFSYSDEFLECVFILLFVIRIVKKGFKKLLKYEKKLLISYFLLVLLTLISSFIAKKQALFYMVIDMLIYLKFIIMYFSVRLFFNKPGLYDECIHSLAKIVRVILCVLSLIVLHDLVFMPWFPRVDYRYFMYSFQLCFGHPTGLAIASFTCYIVILIEQGLSYSRKNNYYIIISLFLCLFSLRSKAIAAVACSILILCYFIILKSKSKVPLYVGIVLFAIKIGKDQIVFHFRNSATKEGGFIRKALLIDSFDIAKKYFPLGSGFGTFGSNVAAEHYSPLYYEYGYSNIVGASPDKPYYLSDSFWPIIFGQSGFVGFILFCYALYMILKIVNHYLKLNAWHYVAGLSILIYELIGSFGESAFFHPTAWMIFALLGLIVNYSLKDR